MLCLFTYLCICVGVVPCVFLCGSQKYTLGVFLRHWPHLIFWDSHWLWAHRFHEAGCQRSSESTVLQPLSAGLTGGSCHSSAYMCARAQPRPVLGPQALVHWTISLRCSTGWFGAVSFVDKNQSVIFHIKVRISGVSNFPWSWRAEHVLCDARKAFPLLHFFPPEPHS